MITRIFFLDSYNIFQDVNDNLTQLVDAKHFQTGERACIVYR